MDLKKCCMFQGLFQLLETNVTIRCRKEDLELVKVCYEVLRHK